MVTTKKHLPAEPPVTAGGLVLRCLLAGLIVVTALLAYLPKAHEALHLAEALATCRDGSHPSSHGDHATTNGEKQTNPRAAGHSCAVTMLAAGAPLALAPIFIHAPLVEIGAKRLIPDKVATVCDERLQPPGRAPPALG